ncbi:hypothetical membrane protein [Renibacterium salmoninarum ATCC 33209]|uniref:Hypothetical membrane protein n=1 Tax=Renibacterium salmoninarum (strain ATCC 33209 / DSM 20767 / JCM 11484 / NBRC 15589 / NCIMB 2235) TaxID=288705 RepID=A9WM87_RENSM|nr:hypothetical protein [Renibacterium salmoninarum]ABY22219.1 hypothetical membrane protein [Renibacterium salmoninarum ATCC 33209]
MSSTVTGIAVGAFLAAALAWGFWGFILMLIFMAFGAILGRAAEGKLDFLGVIDALTGKWTSS